MNPERPLPQELLDEIARNASLPPPDGDPAPFVRQRSPCRYCGEDGGDCPYVCC